MGFHRYAYRTRSGFWCDCILLRDPICFQHYAGRDNGVLSSQSAGEAPAPISVNPHFLLIPISTAIGGLIAGLLVFGLAPEAEGHGTDAAIDAYHNKGGVIRRRVPIIKTIASAFTIGSGGSAGRGPYRTDCCGLWLDDRRDFWIIC